MEARTMDHLAHLEMNGSPWRSRGRNFRHELAEIGHDHICALFPKRISLVSPVHTDHEPEAARMPGSDACQCILDDNGTSRLNRQAPRRFPECIRCRFPRKPETIDVMTVDATVEQSSQTDGFEDFSTMVAGGHDGCFQSSPFGQTDELHRSRIDVHTGLT